MRPVPSYAVPKSIAEVARLLVEHPMADAVVEEIDGRRIQVDGHWLIDFASCNYLGLDLDAEVIARAMTATFRDAGGTLVELDWSEWRDADGSAKGRA